MKVMMWTATNKNGKPYTIEVMVDDDVYERYQGRPLTRSRHNGALASVYLYMPGPRKTFARVIVDCPAGSRVWCKDGDPCNLQRSNLEIRGCLSRFKNVSRANGSWRIQIYGFTSEDDAAKAIQAAKKIRGW